MTFSDIKKRYFAVAATVIVVICGGLALFFLGVRPVTAAADAPQVIFTVDQGEGFRTIADALAAAGLVRSAFVFDAVAVFAGRAGALKAGSYRLSPSMSPWAIAAALSDGASAEATVTIPEGSDIFAIDRILSAALVTQPGAFAHYALSRNLEGYLFPDTYRFSIGESPADIATAMTNDFNAKAAPLLAADPAHAAKVVIIASILEKEVQSQADQEVVAGIILKRIAIGMPLDIDATICYAKSLGGRAAESSTPAIPSGGACALSPVDFTIKSPYNTYLYKGLPPGPIGNPGVSAITAALHPRASSYLYYLTDPATGKTIFAKTLDEQNQNRVKYLEGN